MKQGIRHIAVLLVGGLFIISSTGIYLTIHYCSSENLTGLFFFSTLTEDPCEHHPGDPITSHAHQPNNCCPDNEDVPDFPISAEMPECCSNTVLFISVDDNFLKTDHPYIKISCSSLFAADDGYYTISAIELAGNFNEIDNRDPPPKLYGRKITCFNQAFLL